MSGDTGVMNARTIRMSGPAVARPRVKQKTKTPRTRAGESLKSLETKAFNESKSIPGVSIFAIFGTLVVSVLMVFVVLAQISYNETATLSAQLSAQVRDLEEQRRVLELAFNSSFDIKEVEQYAIEELGMARPDAAQVINISTMPRDTATVIVGDNISTSQGFTDFLKTLTSYFRR